MSSNMTLDRTAPTFGDGTKADGVRAMTSRGKTYFSSPRFRPKFLMFYFYKSKQYLGDSMFASMQAAAIVGLALGFANVGAASTKYVCHDGQSFDAGQILISEDATTYTVLLRGYERHGRTVADLSHDFGLTLPHDGYLAWVGVTFPKTSCALIDQPKAVASCYVPESSGVVIFYSGWQATNLQEVARKSAEVTLALDQLSTSTLAPAGHFEVDAPLQTIDVTRGTIYVSATSGTDNLVYRSTVSVQMSNSFCGF